MHAHVHAYTYKRHTHTQQVAEIRAALWHLLCPLSWAAGACAAQGAWMKHDALTELVMDDDGLLDL